MRTLILLTILAIVPQLANATQRLALIIGNDLYEEVISLDKARSDASAMTATLTNLGFETVTALDANRREMNRAISDFTSRLCPGDTALVFFAGHGIEIDGENYLLPTDIVAPSQASVDFVKFESTALSDLLYRVQSTGARTTLMFLDACRDNPFADASNGRSIGGTRGLARITAPEGTFVVFSAGAGQQALDSLHAQDNDKNSVFTRQLLPKLTRPGLELRQMISELRVEVRDLAKTRQHSQFPAYYDELLGDFYFAGAAPPETTYTQQTAPKPLSADVENNIHEDFRLTKSVNTPTAYRAFLRRYADYPEALPVTLAEQLLASLEVEASDTRNRRLALANPTTAEDPPGPLALAAPIPADQESPEPAPEAKAPAPLSAREIVRQSQELLNGHGCNPGTADGIVGRRTRAAFARFLDEAGSNLPPSSLGTREALIELRTKVVVICTKPVVVAAAPPQKDPTPKAKATPQAKPKVTPAKPKAAAAPKAAAPAKTLAISLAGRWTAHSRSCANVRKMRAKMTKLSPTSYRFSSQIVGMTSDHGTRGIVRVSGNRLKADLYSQVGSSGGWTGTLASNGKSFKVTESSGCTYTFSR